MSRKSNLVIYQTAASVSMSANITSSVTNINYLDNVGIQLVFTGTPVGNFNAQVSVDYSERPDHSVINPGNWTDITFSSQPAAAAASNVIFLDMNQLSAPWIRYTYTFSSGSGILSSFIVCKMV